jgi:hypothetical protein
MASAKKKPRKKAGRPAREDIPPGATRKAFHRPLDPGGGPPGSGAGPRHAAGDPGSDIETTGRGDIDENAVLSPEEEDALEKGPPMPVFPAGLLVARRRRSEVPAAAPIAGLLRAVCIVVTVPLAPIPTRARNDKTTPRQIARGVFRRVASILFDEREVPMADQNTKYSCATCGKTTTVPSDKPAPQC